MNIRGNMMSEIYDELPISDDDIVMNLNYQIVFEVQDQITIICNELFQNDLKKHFKKYTYRNCIRVKDVLFTSDKIVLLIKQVSPDVAMQEVVDEIDKYLISEIERYGTEIKDDVWKYVKIFSIGDPKEVKKDIETYLRKIDDEKNDNEEE